MSPSVRVATATVPWPSVRSLLTAPFRFQTYKNLLYLWIAFPLGIAYFAGVVVGFSVSLSLLVVLVGVPLLLLCFLFVAVTGGVERVLTSRLLAVDIPEPTYDYLREGGLVDRVVGLVTDTTTYTALVYLLSKFAFGIAAFVLVVTSFVVSAVLIATPTYYDRPGVNVGLFPADPITLTPSVSIAWNDLLVGVDAVLEITSWRVDSLPEAVAVSLVGVAVFVLSLNLCNGVAWLWGRYSSVMLGADPLRVLRR
jgi:hypothetical protein